MFIRRHESKIGNLRYVGPHIIRGSVVELTFEASASLSKDQHEVPLHWAMMHVKKSGNATVAQLAPLPDDLNDISYARHVMEFQLEDIRMPTQMLSKTQLSLLLKKQRPVKSQRKCKVEASRRRSSRSSVKKEEGMSSSPEDSEDASKQANDDVKCDSCVELKRKIKNLQSQNSKLRKKLETSDSPAIMKKLQQEAKNNEKTTKDLRKDLEKARKETMKAEKEAAKVDKELIVKCARVDTLEEMLNAKSDMLKSKTKAYDKLLERMLRAPSRDNRKERSKERKLTERGSSTRRRKGDKRSDERSSESSDDASSSDDDSESCSVTSLSSPVQRKRTKKRSKKKKSNKRRRRQR